MNSDPTPAQPPSAPARAHRWAGVLLRLYPRAWRQRYHAEATALLADHHVSPRTLIDLLFGALDAHLHPYLFPAQEPSVTQRLRTSQFVVSCATVIYALALISLQQVRDPQPAWHAAATMHPEIRTGLEAAQILGGSAVLVGLAGFLLVTAAMIRQAATGHSGNLRRLLISGGSLTAAWLLATVIVATVTATRPGTGIRPLRTLDLVLENVWLLGTAVSLTWGAALLWRALSRAELPQPVIRLARLAAATAALAMTAGLLITVIEAFLLRKDEPDLIGLGWLTAITIAMAAAAAMTGMARLRMTPRSSQPI